MGAAAGRVIAERHPPGSPPVRLAWFPGPEGAGWVRFVEAGFREAVARYLSAEARATDGDIDVLTGYGPFRRGPRPEEEDEDGR